MIEIVGWMIVVPLQAMLLIVILALELWSIASEEEDHITFSRLMWRMFHRWPWTRWITGAIIVLMVAFNAWAFVHLIFGPCAWGIC